MFINPIQTSFSRQYVLSKQNSLRVLDPQRLSTRDGEASPRRGTPRTPRSGRPLVTTFEPIQTSPVANTVLNDYYSKHFIETLPALSSIIGTYDPQPDSEENISFNEDQSIKAASRTKTIERILADSGDELFEIFFATYTAFMTPDEFLTVILSMYKPDGIQITLSPRETDSSQVSAMVSPRQNINDNIFECLIYWVGNYAYELPSSVKCRLIIFLREYQDRELEQALVEACQEKDELKVNFPLAMEWEDYLDTLPQKEEEEEEDEEGTEEEDESEDEEGGPILPENWDHETFEFLEWSPKEIARQWTLLDQEYFLRVESRECINDNFNQKRILKFAPNISRIIDNFNNTSRWVVFTILTESDAKRRLQLLEHFIDISAELVDINNYQTVMALGSAFNNNALFRLESLWSQLDQDRVEQLEFLKELLDPSKKFKNLRDASTEEIPCVPYIGIFLSDLSAVEACYTERIGDLVNLNKKRLSTKVMRAMQTYQSYSYGFEKIDFLCEQIRTNVFSNADLVRVDEQELLQMSFKLQPKK